MNSRTEPVVVLDAGHGPAGTGSNHMGACYNGLVEAALTWETCQRMKHSIPSVNGWLHMTRPTPWDTPSLQARADIANGLKASFFLSVHYNAVSHAGPCGIETLYCMGSAKGELAAKAFQASLVRQTGARDRGLVPRGDLVVLKNTKCPAVLVELGFLSNPYEAALIRSEIYQQAICQGLINGLWDALRAIGALPDTRPGSV